MKALVTGAGGFIGSHLVEYLVETGNNVTALVHYRGDGHRGWLEECAHLDEIEVLAGDVRDSDSMRRRVLAKPFDVVFNLAALISIPHSYDNPDDFIDTNVRGCLNVLNAVRSLPGCKLVQMSTSEVYGTAQTVPMTTKHPLNAQSPYAASKTGADQLCLAYEKSFGVDVCIARTFNTYGPRQSQRSVIPNVVAQILRSPEREVDVKVGAIEATRDFTFVFDTVRALHMLGTSDAPGVWHIGSGVETPIDTVVRTAGTMLGRVAAPVLDDNYVRPAASEVRRLVCDAEPLREAGWKPMMPLPDGIKKTADWMRPRLQEIRKGRVT